MQTLVQSIYYPISLDEIKSKVARKNGRRNGLSDSKLQQTVLFSNHQLDNIKEIVNEFGEKIIRVDGEIPPDLPVKDGDRFLFISYDQSILTHGLHKYPAKFFPELPRWLIKRYSKEGNLILDPFAGSGTTNIEALLTRRPSIGIDIDPFSRYLSKVKITPLDEDELQLAQKYLLRFILNYKPSKISEEDIPVFPYRDNWFNKEIILELAYLKKIINALDISKNIKDFFRICFSSIIRSVSNADDNCTRTVIRKKLNKKVYPADALKKFTEVILISVPKMIEFSQNCPLGISVSFPDTIDARNINYQDYFDLAVTSPPYANAVDYPRTHQLESYWLGLTSGSLTPLKKKYVGTESVSSSEYKKLHEIGVEEADITLSKIFNKDPRRSYIAFKYLDDMRLNLLEVYKSLKKEGRYIVVVGNNKIRGELFENWKYIMELAKNIGFKVENYFASEIIKHFIKVPRGERINTDWIIVLRK
ncbi:site-specific DNA-methyltransferase [bacterium]|nr:site-specific DNA-methyltransferase [bacterium]MBU1152588.1 site-specific DNA-methyltransferase [bacterium]MBU1782195.1 site-specific DNA-methyltransferase [bacterium]MBU2600280.1 site-specific DNA-methyltransferase [bacterium]